MWEGARVVGRPARGGDRHEPGNGRAYPARSTQSWILEESRDARVVDKNIGPRPRSGRGVSAWWRERHRPTAGRAGEREPRKSGADMGETLQIGELAFEVRRSPRRRTL